ncbi:MAG: alpha/beta fold hydrolase [Candidatus Hodarchaeota archaeon]
MVKDYAKVNGIKICYEIRGEGYPLILIHGFGVTKEEWIGQFLPLSEFFKVIRFDNRGSGKSDHPNEPYTMKLFADDLKGLMENLLIEQAHIVGWSVGGMIAQVFTLNYPEKVNKLVLINTLPYWPGEETGLDMYKQSKIDALKAVKEDPVKAFYDSATPGFSRKFKKLLMEEPKEIIHGLFSAEDLIEKDKRNPITVQDIENYTHALGTYNVLEKLPNIKKETLILCGTHDRSTPQSMNELIHEKIPNSKLIILEKAGHGSPIERAPEINKYIIEFLQ